MSDADEVWPDELMLRDTKLHDDLGGGGQRIYTTAGQGYKKVRYVLAEKIERELAACQRERDTAREMLLQMRAEYLEGWAELQERAERAEAALEKARVSPNALDALEAYQQADPDGVLVKVSRQALDEAIRALRGAQNAEVAEVAMETPASQGAPSASAPAAPLVERWNRVAQVLSAAFPANHPCMLDCAEVGLAIKRNAAALEAAQWDARRYRWLRDNSANQYEHPIVVSQERTERGITYTGPLFDSMLDAAIDAAVRK